MSQTTASTARHPAAAGTPACTQTRAAHAAMTAEPGTPAPRKLFPADVGALCDPPLSGDTISRYHSKARVARERAARIAAGTATQADRDGPQPGPRDMPPPDDHEVPPTRQRRSGPPAPYWLENGPIAAWLAARHHPGHPRTDGQSPAPPGSQLGRPPLKFGPKPKEAEG